MNLLKRKEPELDARIASSEKVTLLGRTIDAWKIDAVGADGTRVTMWIDKHTYRLVKKVEAA